MKRDLIIEIWIGYNNGELYKTTNGTSSSPIWSKITNLSQINQLFCTRITIDPQNHNVVYVTVGGYTRNNIWKTINGGFQISKLK